MSSELWLIWDFKYKDYKEVGEAMPGVLKLVFLLSD